MYDHYLIIIDRNFRNIGTIIFTEYESDISINSTILDNVVHDFLRMNTNREDIRIKELAEELESLFTIYCRIFPSAEVEFHNYDMYEMSDKAIVEAKENLKV